jgi:hypothetical protein
MLCGSFHSSKASVRLRGMNGHRADAARGLNMTHNGLPRLGESGA